MPDWVIPTITGLAGGGLGTIISALTKARGYGFTQMNAIVSALQAEREADRKDNAALSMRVDNLYVQLGGWRDYGSAWEDWHAAGMPDPPGRPQRPGSGIITVHGSGS